MREDVSLVLTYSRVMRSLMDRLLINDDDNKDDDDDDDDGDDGDDDS